MGVLVSGAGTNLRAILRASGTNGYPAEVVAVASNRPGCPALEIGRRAGVPTRSFPATSFSGDAEARDRAMTSWLLEEGVSLVVLAGYDRILTRPLLRAFPDRVLNLHNSLLPAFAGTMSAVQAALDHGVKVTGCTVHLVDEDYLDGGPIVLQAAVAVEDDDSAESLLARIHAQEWRILPEAIAMLARGEIRVEGRRVLRLDPRR
ncbi:MAG TPA: phosphoribosylglycinamide formyltransferase [Candidatus Saccharimonadales bacterium]|nr:phosphoribosylglycinamide formyltransferase [Candidatus Saccharimonadales bacterium]